MPTDATTAAAVAEDARAVEGRTEATGTAEQCRAEQSKGWKQVVKSRATYASSGERVVGAADTETSDVKAAPDSEPRLS